MAEFSADGRAILTASEDGTARLWDAASLAATGNPMRHQGGVRAAGFSRDGALVVTASRDATARVWDARSGNPVSPPLRHDGQVNWAAFSPDGSRVATASDDRTARVWDTRSGQAVGPPLRHDGPVTSARFAASGFVVTGSQDGTARVWQPDTGIEVARLPHPAAVVWAAFSPDGTRVVTASADRSARVWDVLTGRPEDAPLLAALAEAVSGRAVDERGVVRPSDHPQRALADARERASREAGAQASAGSFARWLFADPATRTISPLSRVAVPEYVSRLLSADAAGGPQEAARSFPGLAIPATPPAAAPPR
jgi:hypothetical protein